MTEGISSASDAAAVPSAKVQRPRFEYWSRRLLEWNLLAFAFSVPLGEGLAQILFGALAAFFLGSRFLFGPMVAQRSPLWERWRGPIVAAFAAYFLAMYLPLPFHGFSGVGWPSSGELAKPLNMLIFPLLLWAGRYVDGRLLRRLVLAFLLGVALASVMGLAQYLFAIRWGGQLAGLADFSGQRAVPGDEAGVAATGTLFNRLKMAHVLVIGLGVTLGLLLRGGIVRVRDRLILVGVFLLQLLVLPFTFTRGALVAAVVVVAAAAILFAQKWGRVAVVVALLPVAVLMVTSPSLRQRVAAIVSGQDQYVRLFLWGRALEIGAEETLVGTGYGTYVNIARRVYNSVDPKVVYPWKRSHHLTGHNQFLTAYAEGGALGAGALIVMFIAFGMASYLGARAGPPSLGTGLAVGAYLAVLGVCLIALIHDAFHHVPVMYAFFLSMAMMFIAPTSVEQRD